MKTTVKKFFYWGLGCIKRGVILIFPMFFVGMLLLDVVTMSEYHYSSNLSVYVLSTVGVLFYLSSLYCIFIPLNKYNKTLFILFFCLFIGVFNFSPDIKDIYRQSKCQEGVLDACK